MSTRHPLVFCFDSKRVSCPHPHTVAAPLKGDLVTSVLESPHSCARLIAEQYLHKAAGFIEVPYLHVYQATRTAGFIEVPYLHVYQATRTSRRRLAL